jgi:hypothetical protein
MTSLRSVDLSDSIWSSDRGEEGLVGATVEWESAIRLAENSIHKVFQRVNMLERESARSPKMTRNRLRRRASKMAAANRAARLRK